MSSDFSRRATIPRGLPNLKLADSPSPKLTPKHPSEEIYELILWIITLKWASIGTIDLKSRTNSKKLAQYS